MDSQMTQSEAFLNAINEESLKNRVDIITEANRYKAEETAKAQTHAKRLYNEKVAAELAKINRRAGQAVSAKEKEYRLTALEKRAEITDSVFSAAREELIKFTQSDAYSEYLKNNLLHALSVCSDKSVTVCLKPDDLKYTDTLTSCAANSLTFKADDSIDIGGIKCECPELNLIIDDTLTQRLNEQKTWFYENSGLNI